MTTLLSMTFCLVISTDPLPGTLPLMPSPDRSAEMVEGIHRFLVETAMGNAAKRARDATAADAKSPPDDGELLRRRDKLRQLVGAVDRRVPNPRFQYVSTNAERPGEPIASTAHHKIYQVRWPVFDDVWAEGLLCQLAGNVQKSRTIDAVVMLPDADDSPYAALRLGGRQAKSTPAYVVPHLDDSADVLVATLVDRRDEHSGNERLGRFTNQPHREWIYRQAYEMGRHIVGYEVQAVEAALDCLSAMRDSKPREFALIGYGEGAFVSNYAAKVSGRFKSARLFGLGMSAASLPQASGQDFAPLYRNIFGGWIANELDLGPRAFLIDARHGPVIAGPPPSRSGRHGAAPFWSIQSEESAPMRGRIFGRNLGALLEERRLAPAGIGGEPAKPKPETPKTRLTTSEIESEERSAQRRLVRAWTTHTQQLMREAESVRQARIDKLLAKNKDGAAWDRAVAPMRLQLWKEVLGQVDVPKVSMNPRSRWFIDKPKWTGYEVTLEVWPHVFAWGYLLVPKGIAHGERRPVVVCQHGLEGLPNDTIEEDPNSAGFRYYKAFAARLAERGFVVFSPHNPYRGQDKFRVLQRLANPLGLSLFSIIIGQHDRILDFLCEQPFVDPKRIGFYGLSYGGKTAMRVPAVLDRYCLSICSADFNDWIKKCVTVDDGYSYMFTGEYEMPEWNLGYTFNYAEMAACICPRPFMVERGHDDGVAPDEWVAYEFAKVRRLYDKLNIGDRTAIEFFNGPHSINAQGTFEFLHRHLNWPAPHDPLP